MSGHHKALSASAAAAAAARDLDGEETEPTAVSPTAAWGEYRCLARCATVPCAAGKMS